MITKEVLLYHGFAPFSDSTMLYKGKNFPGGFLVNIKGNPIILFNFEKLASFRCPSLDVNVEDYDLDKLIDSFEKGPIVFLGALEAIRSRTSTLRFCKSALYTFGFDRGIEVIGRRYAESLEGKVITKNDI